MAYVSIISAIAALFCVSLATFVFLQAKRSFINLTFAFGMLALAVEAVFTSLTSQAVLPSEIIQWQRMRLIATAFIPGCWLLFSLGFARVNQKEILVKWRWVILGVFGFPFILVTGFWNSLFKGIAVLGNSSGWLIRLGWPGYVLYIFILVTSALILMNLERILRASSGSIRWQIKFLILGVGSIFAIRIYTGSQILLFQSLNMTLEVANTGALIFSNVLIIWSLIRSRLLNINVYFPESFIYNSIIILVMGIYLLAVGVLAKVLSYFNIPQAFLLDALIVFLAFLGLTVILLSNQMREKIRQFISLYFKRSQYDYRVIWTSFTQRTASLLGIKDICGTVTKMVSEIFGVPCVTILLVGETQRKLSMGGSTVFSSDQIQDFILAGKGAEEIIKEMKDQQMPIDFGGSENGRIGKFKEFYPDYLLEGRIRYGVSLLAGGEFLGIMTLNEKLTKETFSLEDIHLLKTIADQTAGSIFNVRMSDRLRQAKEIEAIQSMSSFFIHDLKNLASKLSMTMQNLPVHFENPEFRKDALGTISESVSKINTMCSNLSLLRQTVALQPTEVDFNELITSNLRSLNGYKASIQQDLVPLPKFAVDPEQIQKVITNLLLNANEAVRDGGEIRISTREKDGWAVLSISDNGCGMSKEFMEKFLFRPFKTTKKQGMGIGLFHSKMIVEAHRGRIEVESEEGRGTTFKVFLPIDRE